VIKRSNVFEFEGQDKFKQHFDTKVRDEIASKWPEVNQFIDHYYGLCLMFLFKIDPEQDSLEQEKLDV